MIDFSGVFRLCRRRTLPKKRNETRFFALADAKSRGRFPPAAPPARRSTFDRGGWGAPGGGKSCARCSRRRRGTRSSRLLRRRVVASGAAGGLRNLLCSAALHRAHQRRQGLVPLAALVVELRALDVVLDQRGEPTVACLGQWSAGQQQHFRDAPGQCRHDDCRRLPPGGACQHWRRSRGATRQHRCHSAPDQGEPARTP